MYLGLNCTHLTGSVWSPFNTHTFVPFSAFQICTLPSVDPDITNCESGENDASRGILLLFKWPVNVCNVSPLKLSMRRIRDPLVDISTVFPSGLNLRPVHSTSLSTETKQRDNIIRLWFHNLYNRCYTVYKYSFLQHTWKLEGREWPFIKTSQII